MEIRQLGRSGLHVSALGFGAMTFGSGAMGFGQPPLANLVGGTDLEGASRIVAMCIDHGINFFDTANNYSMGQSEEILGQALGARRHDVLIATKGTGHMKAGPQGLGASRRYFIEACEDSLCRLGTDYIDVYQIHQFDELTPLDETLRAMDDLVRAGKIRYIGVSNFTASQLMKALCLSERRGWDRCISQQIYYSLVSREAEWELLQVSRSEGVGTIIWSPLAFGLLSGKYRRGEAAPQGARASVMGGPGNVSMERVYAVVAVLEQIATERGVSVAQVAMNYILHKPDVDTVLVGARTEAQLRDNLAAASWRLSDDEVKRLDAVSYVSPPYPYWHQSTYGAARNPTYAAMYKG